MDSLNRDAPTVQRAGLGALWGGQEVEASFVPKTKKTIFFVSGSFWFFSRFFCSCHPLSFLSFGDHHFFPSRLSHRAPPSTRLGTHLAHVPLHPCTPCLCKLRVVFPPKTLLFTQHTLFFCSLQSLELVFPPQSKGVSRCDCFCRFPPNPTTHLHYNFSNTSLVFFLCTVKWTQLLNPLNLGCFSKSPKEGAQQVFLDLPLLPPFSPLPYPLFDPFAPCFSVH
jgi:hypothetical protein